jgi:hypothetical protein
MRPRVLVPFDDEDEEASSVYGVVVGALTACGRYKVMAAAAPLSVGARSWQLMTPYEVDARAVPLGTRVRFAVSGIVARKRLELYRAARGGGPEEAEGVLDNVADDDEEDREEEGWAWDEDAHEDPETRAATVLVRMLRPNQRTADAGGTWHLFGASRAALVRQRATYEQAFLVRVRAVAVMRIVVPSDGDDDDDDDDNAYVAAALAFRGA